mgnify:CR=1 FL=1
MQMAASAFFRIVARARPAPTALVSAAGRFNSMESPPTCYVADDLATAWAEVAWPLGSDLADPGGFKAFRVETDNARLLDLTDQDQANLYLVDPVPLAARAFADELRRSSDYDGIRYPSMRRPNHHCVVLFLEKLGDRLTAQPLERGSIERVASNRRAK